MVNEDFSKGINGVSAISDIPDGYILEAENVDLSEPGKVKRRAGYNLHGCRLPVRTRRAEIPVAPLGSKVIELDAVRVTGCTLGLIRNSGANLSNLANADHYQTNDATNTIMVKLAWPGFTPGVTVVPPVTTDTIFQIEQGTGGAIVVYSYRPIKVYDSGEVSGTAYFLLPYQLIYGWSSPPTLVDVAATNATAYLCDGFTFPRLPAEDVTSIVLSTGFFREATITFVAGSVWADLPLYTFLTFETCLHKNAIGYRKGSVGYIKSKTSTTVVVEMAEDVTESNGSISITNLSVMYTTAKHLTYIAQANDRQFATIGTAVTPASATAKIRIDDCVRIACTQDRLALGSSGSVTGADLNEIGYLYGLEVDVGYINCLNKYYNATTGNEELFTGYSGSFFIEQTILDRNRFYTQRGLQYTGVTTTVIAGSGLFAISITNADLVYQVGDTTIISYESDWKGTIVTKQYVVTAVSSTTLTLNANGDTRLYLPQYTKIRFSRTSSVVFIYPSPLPYAYFSDMVMQSGDSNPLAPFYRVKDLYIPNTSNYVNYMELDTEITWESDSYLTASKIFYPIFPEGVTAPINTYYLPSDIVDYNSVELDRSIVVAARENGMWRFNGSQFLNMRIPRPPSGFIRNVRGTNGYLAIDTGDDGLLTGRQYDFIVTYSYVELVNGKLVTYESGLSPVGAYSIVSEPALELSGDSQLVELQVPTIPLGIGLPATSMFINVYRTKSGTIATQGTSEEYLLERQVVNNPYLPYQTILAGTEAPFLFNRDNYKVLYASIQTDVTSDELAREIIDPPLATVVTALENRVIAANGGEVPYLNLICKNVFNSSDAFAANALVRYTPPNVGYDYSYVFFALSLTPVSTGGTFADESGVARTYQVFTPASVYDLSVIAYTDNSHLFRITGATIVVDTKYLLRFAAGKTEGFVSGGKDPYYDGFGFEQQTFVGTNAGTAEVSAQKKWISKSAGGTVTTPAETFIVFAESQKIENIASDNGLIITGTAGDAGTESDTAAFTLKIKGSSTTYSVGDYLILKGLGTTGQVKDADGAVLNFDNDIICEVLTAVTASDPDVYTIAICVMANDTSGVTSYKRVKVKSALSVTNVSSGITHPPFTIYLRQSATARAVTNFSLPSATATLTITTAPALTINAGDDIIVDGLPFDIPRGSGANWNRKYKAVSYGAGAFVVTAPVMPEELRGVIGTTLSSPVYGKLSIPKNIFSYYQPTLTESYLQVLLSSQVLTVAMSAGAWVYIITRGRENDSYSPLFSGWYKTSRYKNNVGNWVTSLAIGAAMTGIELDLQTPTAYLPTLDFSTLTGVSELKVVVCQQGFSGVANSVYLPVPVPLIRRDDPYLSDLTGTMYGPTDGYTPLEKVIRRFTHAINFVLHNKMFAYWGGRRAGNDESSHPGNVLPTNGLKILPHLYPVDKQLHRYTSTAISTATEASWSLYGGADYWRIEGSTRSNGGGTTSAVTTYTAKETRPSRIWYTNPTGTLVGQAFRELSYDEVESQDGESVVALAPMQTFGLLFKKSSSWRIAFNNGATLLKDRIPSIVGASSAKNVVPTPKGAFVLHDSGIYITDGGTMEDILQPSRIFRDRVSQNVDLFRFTAGYHNPFSKTIYLGIPLSATKGETTDVVDGQFVFNYSNRSITLYSVDTGWSVNTQFPATFWTRILSDSFFASTEGKVFRLRRERTKTAYSDERNAIPFKVRTRYVDSQDPVGVRFYRSVFFQFGTETTNTMEVAIAYDFGTTYAHISSFTVDTSEAANAVTSVTLNDKAIDVVRRTPPFPRAANISLQITNEELDTAAELHGIFFESSDGSTKLVSQPGT